MVVVVTRVMAVPMLTLILAMLIYCCRYAAGGDDEQHHCRRPWCAGTKMMVTMTMMTVTTMALFWFCSVQAAV